MDQEEAKEESTPHFLSREIGEDSTASHLPSGEMDANLMILQVSGNLRKAA